MDPQHPAPRPSQEPPHGQALAGPPRAGLAYDRRSATRSERVPARPGAPLDVHAVAATLLESAYEGICTTDATGTITYANPRLASMLGWPLAELPGRSLFDFMDGDTAFGARTRFARRQRGIAETVELPLRRRDGTTLWTNESASSLSGADGTFAGALFLYSDLTERVRADAAARAQGAVLETVLANIPLMVVLLGATEEVEWVNREWERVLGWTLAEMHGNDMLAELFPDPRVRTNAAAFMAAAPREWRRFTTRARDGSDVVVSWTAIRLPDGRAIGIGRDDSAVVVGEAARAELEERLRQAQKMEAVGQLAGGVAHDFNNLLTVICGNLEFLRADLPVGHPVRPDVEEIGHAAERARTLVRQLLTLSRKQSIRPRHVRVRELVWGAEKLLRRVIGEEIVLEVHVDEQATVHVDPGQLEQVLMNLAVNARDAMLTPLHGHPGTGGTLTIDVDEIPLVATDARRWGGLRPGRWVRLRVRDTGHGMDDATRARAFEPFFTTKPVGSGTGLGLATVFGIVRQAGGAIRVDSAPGAGTTVTIVLPSWNDPAGMEGGAPTPILAGGRRATILLVEDEAVVRVTARRMLERRGYAVIDARHGADALLMWRAHRTSIDCVVTDLRMPEMGGRELVALLRGDTPWLPVVFVSGYSDRGLVVAPDAREAFVEKPFATEALLAAVRRVMEDETPRGE